MSEETIKKKSGRGGARPGAGRPKGTSRLYNFRADHEIADSIDAHPNKTDYIKDCIATVLELQKSGINRLGEVIPASQLMSASVPFFDLKIVAGFPIPLNNDERAEKIDFVRMVCPHPDSSYLIRVTGDSMIDAGMCDGDILVVDRSQRNPTEKEIAVCELNGEYTVKNVVVQDGRKWLVPANPKFPKIEIKDGDSFSVWGVVTYMLRKPKMD